MRSFLKYVRRLAAELRFGFCRLTELQYSAPWNSRSSRCG